MTQETKRWERNIQGLEMSAQNKAAATRQRAEDAIAFLQKQQQPINFKAVAETAGISTAWLYAHEDIKDRIISLRAQNAPKLQMKLPVRERASDASKDAMIAALQKRVCEQSEKIKELEKQLEVAYSSLYQR
ncbi:hypothetical protein KSD_67490 [Ktedonobacter sp. SOSP1-85]|uniref:DUF6262 family protein n=1 Tax=Ktedonobacter sp. SOSP1-85 TaxID=2778367 RepID=UPI001915D09B|nr:DUF6262 family protein [Ktedonobacter sp. SOSP1-85]GHO78978.1 hypothetical protein KSD_67490 [Ktedonobacter sp. SOSP1-85]